MLRNEANCKARDSSPESSRGSCSIRGALTAPERPVAELIPVARRKLIVKGLWDMRPPPGAFFA
jgi:hypothetical protein